MVWIVWGWVAFCALHDVWFEYWCVTGLATLFLFSVLVVNSMPVRCWTGSRLIGAFSLLFICRSLARLCGVRRW